MTHTVEIMSRVSTIHDLLPGDLLVWHHQLRLDNHREWLHGPKSDVQGSHSIRALLLKTLGTSGMIGAQLLLLLDERRQSDPVPAIEIEVGYPQLYNWALVWAHDDLYDGHFRVFRQGKQVFQYTDRW